MNSMYQQLMRLPLFQGVGTAKITALVEKLPFHFLKYRNGERIIAAGETCTHVRFIVSGRVRVETPCRHLKISLSQTLSTPHVLAAEYLFGLQNVYPYTAVADGPCGILQLTKGDYVKMVSADKVFLFNILNYLSSGSQRNLSSVLNVGSSSVVERLVTMIDTMAIADSTDVVLRYKQRDLCAMLGTQRATLIAALDKLALAGALSYVSNELRVLDYSLMMEFARK